MERDDPFYVQPECVADSGDASSSFRVFAVFDCSDYLVTGTCGEYKFGEVWREGHYPGRGGRKAQGGAICLLKPDLRLCGERAAGE